MGAAESSLNTLLGCGGAPEPDKGALTVNVPNLHRCSSSSSSAEKSDSHKIPLIKQASFCSKAYVRRRSTASAALNEADAELKRLNEQVRKVREEQRVYDAQVRRGKGVGESAEDKEADWKRKLRHQSLMAKCAEVQQVVRQATDKLQDAQQNLLSGTGENAQRNVPVFFRVKCRQRGVSTEKDRA